MTSLYRNLFYIGIIILAVIAVFLGIAIYKQVNPRNPQKPTSQNQSVPSPIATQSASENLLTFPGPNATNEEKKQFSTNVQKAAKISDTLDITSCNPNPLILLVKLGDEFKIKNDDGKEHKLYFGGIQKFSVLSYNIKEVKAEFDKGVGLYGYTCDKSSGSVTGIIYVK